jgi:hypothetical protein
VKYWNWWMKDGQPSHSRKQSWSENLSLTMMSE